MSFISNFIPKFTSKDGSESSTLPILFEFAIEKDNVQIVGLSNLTDKLINYPLPNGELPLHFAIRNRSLKIIDHLFNHDQTVIAKKDDQGLTALDHLFLTNDKNYQAEVLGLFFKRILNDVKETAKNISPAQVDFIKKQVVFIENKKSEFDKILSQIETRANVNQITSNGQTPLHFAAYHNDVELLEKLINLGANPNVPDDLGLTPIHYAIFNKNEDFIVLRYLIERGADPSINSHEITPLALMAHVAEIRSNERDPLKQDLLQTLLCVCSIATWIQRYYGNEFDVLAVALQFATSTLFSCMTLDHLLKAYNSSHDLKSFLQNGANVALPLVFNAIDYVPVLGEVSLAFRTYGVAQSVFQGLKSGWRNCKLDPIKSLKMVTINSTNAAFSIWNIQHRMQRIWNDYLKSSVDFHLKNNDCIIALKEASKINLYPLRDKALLEIVEQCVKTNMPTAESAYLKIQKSTIQDRAVNLIFQFYLGNQQTEKALETISKMDEGNKNIAWISLGKSYLERGECEKALECADKIEGGLGKEEVLENIIKNAQCTEKNSAIHFKAIMKMGNFKKRDQMLLTKVNNFLAQGLCEKAVEMAELLVHSENQDNANINIATNLDCLKNNPQLSTEALEKITSSYRKIDATKKVFNYYFEDNMLEEAFAIIKDNSSAMDDCLKKLLDSPKIVDFMELRLEAALKLSNLLEQNNALEVLVDDHLKANQYEKALNVAKAMHFGHTKLKSIINHPCSKDYPNIRFKEILNLNSSSIQNFVLSIPDGALIDLVNDQLNLEQFDSILEYVDAINNIYNKNTALSKVVERSGMNASLTDLSINAASKITSLSKQSESITELLKIKLNRQQFSEAIMVAKAFPDRQELKKTLIETAQNVQLIMAHPELASQIDLLIDPLKKDCIITNRIESYLEIKEYQHAQKELVNFDSLEKRNQALRIISLNNEFIKNNPNSSLTLASQIENDESSTLLSLADALTKAEYFEYAIEAAHLYAQKAHLNSAMVERDIILKNVITSEACMEKRSDLVIPTINLMKSFDFESACEYIFFLLKKNESKQAFEAVSHFQFNSNESVLSQSLYAEIANDENCANNNPHVAFKAISRIDDSDRHDTAEKLAGIFLKNGLCDLSLKVADREKNVVIRNLLYENIAKDALCCKNVKVMLEAASKIVPKKWKLFENNKKNIMLFMDKNWKRSKWPSFSDVLFTANYLMSQILRPLFINCTDGLLYAKARPGDANSTDRVVYDLTNKEKQPEFVILRFRECRYRFKCKHLARSHFSKILM